MISNKINKNHCCILIIFLIILFLIYRLSTNNITNNTTDKITQNYITKINKIEHFFAPIAYTNYGNVISLKDTKNLPVYFENQIIFELDNVYRIDKLIFLFNTIVSTDDSATPIYVNTKPLYVQYMDRTGTMRYLKSTDITSSPPDLRTKVVDSTLTLTGIIDENSLSVYTSKIVIVVEDSANRIMNYTNAAGTGYIKEHGIFGGDRSLLSKADYDTLDDNLEQTPIASPVVTTGSTTDIKLYTFPAISSNKKIYSLQLTIAQTGTPNPRPTLPAIDPDIPSRPFYITLKYKNSYYTAETFTIRKQYIIRNDINKLDSTKTTAFIFLNEPIIANTLICEVINIGTAYTLAISSIILNASNPTESDINDFKRIVNVSLNQNNIDGDVDLCSDIDKITEKQTKIQQICDNLEYQDKIKSEKLRLERNKQYLIKLKQQQEQIDDLNTVIEDLEAKRQARASMGDQSRVLQYQKQKGDASTIRDLANQRLESQDNNKLFLDLNINNDE